MKIKDFLINFSFVPLKKGQVLLPTTAKLFLNKLDNITEKDFALGQFFNYPGESHRHNYQCEINGTTFKLRRIQNNTVRPRFIWTVVYCKLIESKDIVTLKYFAIFNIFANILFLIISLAGLYGVFIFFNSEFSEYKLLLVFLFAYLVFLILFNWDASDDINFVKSLTRFLNSDTKADT